MQGLKRYSIRFLALGAVLLGACLPSERGGVAPMGGETGTEPSGTYFASDGLGGGFDAEEPSVGDETASQPGPGGSMPGGIPAPAVDRPQGIITIEAVYDQICYETSEDRVRTRLTGKIRDGWLLTKLPETCSFGGEKALRIVYPVDDPALGKKRFIDVPLDDEDHFSAVFSTSSFFDTNYFVLRRESDEATEEQLCDQDVCVDPEGDHVYSGTCLVIKFVSTFVAAPHDAPPPSCKALQILKKSLPVELQLNDKKIPVEILPKD